MKVRILDKAPFQLLNPADVATHLQATGWKKHDDRPGYSSTWLKEYKGETADLLLPVDRSVGDYLLRMIDAVRLIAAVEERSELETLADLQFASTDILRIRFRYADAADGAIPLLQAEKLVESAKEMFLAAGSAVNARRAYFATNRTEEVRQFVQNLRLGQSERGSYIVTVLSRVTPELKSDPVSLFSEPEPPFERKAVAGLNAALVALRNAVDRAATSFSSKVFHDAVQDGVSANLCSALVNMNGTNPQPADELRFGFTWARSRPYDGAASRDVSFPAESFPILAEAARVLKATAPLDPQDVQGVVVKLQAKDDGGVATVSTFIEGQPRKVTIALTDGEHKKAIQAYDKRTEIVCRGVLTRNGQLWALQYAGPLTVLSEDS